MGARQARARVEVCRSPSGQLPLMSQGSPHGRFQRAIRDRDLRRATMAAPELGNVSLADALALTLADGRNQR